MKESKCKTKAKPVQSDGHKVCKLVNIGLKQERHMSMKINMQSHIADTLGRLTFEGSIIQGPRGLSSGNAVKGP